MRSLANKATGIGSATRYPTSEVDQTACSRTQYGELPTKEGSVAGSTFAAIMRCIVSRPVLSFKSVRFARRWVATIAAAKRVVAFSPFITRCAVTEALAKRGPTCQLYTVVTVENYASGGSSVSCLRRLFDAKVQIYHLDDLHAKILLIPDELVTIGSQNMTGGGTTNREASVVWKDEKAAKQTWQEVRAWMDVGKLLTEAVVKNLENTITRLRQQHVAWTKTAKQVTDDIWDKWQQEEDQKQRAAEAAAAATRRRRQWHGFKERCASDVIQGEVVERRAEWSLSNRGQYPAPSYCKWKVDWQENPLILKLGQWLPCFHLDTRQWGKARVFREVISFIDRGMGWGKSFVVGNAHYNLLVKCRLPTDDLPQYNLEIDVYHRGGGRAVILGQYNISNLTADVVRCDVVDEEDFGSEVVQQVADAINANDNELQEELLKLIHGRWRKRSLRRSKRVDQFFLQNETIYTGLRAVDGRYVLVFSKSRSDAVEKTVAAPQFE